MGRRGRGRGACGKQARPPWPIHHHYPLPKPDHMHQSAREWVSGGVRGEGREVRDEWACAESVVSEAVMVREGGWVWRCGGRCSETSVGIEEHRHRRHSLAVRRRLACRLRHEHRKYQYQRCAGQPVLIRYSRGTHRRARRRHRSSVTRSEQTLLVV